MCEREKTMEERKKSKKPIIIGVVSAVAVVAIAVTLVLTLSSKAIRATTMRMLRMEGTVTLEENGKEKEVREDLRLKSGNAVNTEAASLCSIGLDDFKIVTMNEISRAEFNKKGKALDLNLTRGSLFFEVDKKLASDESFEIKTSTMVVGIRGTSGYVSCDEDGNESVIITDGKVHVVGKNPVTGEVKEIDVPAGSKISVYLYNDREVDSIMFEIVPVKEEDIPQFVTERLRENLVLLDRVVEDTGWSKPVILGEVVDVQLVEVEDDETPLAASIETKEEEETAPEEETVEEAVQEPAAPRSTLPDGVVRNADGTYTLPDGTIFDPNFYGSQYSDLAGMTDEELLNHYLNNGKGEERSANQAEQDAKDAEEAAKQQASAGSGDDDSDSGDSGNTSSNDPNSNNNNNSGNNTPPNTTSYTVEGNDVTDSNGNSVGTYNDGIFSVGSGEISAPMHVNVNGNDQEIKLSNMELNTDTMVGTKIAVGENGKTVIERTNLGYTVSQNGVALTYTDNQQQEHPFFADADGQFIGGQVYAGNTATTGIQLDNTGYVCVITDDGEVYLEEKS